MLKRRNLFNLGLFGWAGALLGWPARPGAAGSSATALRPKLTPFLDALPLPPSPREVLGGFADLDAAAAEYVNPRNDKSTYYRIVAEVRSVKMHAQLPATELWGYCDGNLRPNEAWPYALGSTFRRTLSNNPFHATIVRHINNLPTVAEHRGFGEPRTTVHLHGGHHPARFDGFATDITLPDGPAHGLRLPAARPRRSRR